MHTFQVLQLLDLLLGLPFVVRCDDIVIQARVFCTKKRVYLLLFAFYLLSSASFSQVSPLKGLWVALIGTIKEKTQVFMSNSQGQREMWNKCLSPPGAFSLIKCHHLITRYWRGGGGITDALSILQVYFKYITKDKTPSIPGPQIYCSLTFNVILQ